MTPLEEKIVAAVAAARALAAREANWTRSPGRGRAGVQLADDALLAAAREIIGGTAPAGVAEVAKRRSKSPSL